MEVLCNQSLARRKKEPIKHVTERAVRIDEGPCLVIDEGREVRFCLDIENLYCGFVVLLAGPYSSILLKCPITALLMRMGGCWVTQLRTQACHLVFQASTDRNMLAMRHL